MLENTAPYFIFTDDEPIEYKWNSVYNTWLMPYYEDAEGDEVTVDIDLGDTKRFASWEPEISCCIVRFTLDSTVDVGTYSFSVTLSDGVATHTEQFDVHVVL